MGRANIDLSWLAGLLTDTPTATPNPDYTGDPNDLIPYTDPVTGQTSAGQTPYIKPTKWQELFKPEASQAINNLNTQFSARPAMMKLEHDTKNTLGGQDFDTVRPYQSPSLRAVPSEAGYLLTGGDLRPTATGPEARALSNNMAGVSSIQSNTDINLANKNFADSKNMLEVQPFQAATARQNAINDLATALHVTPKEIQLQANELDYKLGRQAESHELADYILHNNINEQKNIVPLSQKLNVTQIGNEQNAASNIVPKQQALQSTQIENEQNVADARKSVGSTIFNTVTQSAANDYLNSIIQPSSSSPFGSTVGINSNGYPIITRIKDPRFVGMMDNMRANMEDMSGKEYKNTGISVPGVKGATFITGKTEGPVEVRPLTTPLTHNPNPTATVHTDNGMENAPDNADNIVRKALGQYTPPNEFNAVPLSESQSSIVNSPSEKLMDKTEFNKQASKFAFPNDAKNRLMELLGESLGIPHETIGGSTVPRAYYKTIQEHIDDPQYKDKLDSITPEVASYLYKKALQ